MDIDRIKEQQDLADQALAAWKRDGRPCDLMDYFKHQAKADRLKAE